MEMLGVKRLALGVLQQYDTQFAARPTLYHDCSTISGNSGSPLIDLETGTVWGLHYCGDPSGGNRAEPMWEVLRDRTVRNLLGLPAVEREPPTEPAVAVDDRSKRPVFFVRQNGDSAELERSSAKRSAWSGGIVGFRASRPRPPEWP
jgi:hypothetical protein